jgi:hypothetical protein
MFTKINENVKKAKKSCKQEPKTKSYVILCTRDMMIVPIKANLNPYNNRPWFSGGTPQFFGGSADGENDPLKTLQREVTEESRRTLRLNAISGRVFEAPPANGDQNTYNFYYSIEWQRTGTQWNDNVTNSTEREMQRLVEVQLSDMLPDGSDSVIISRLLYDTDTVNAVGINTFRTSHTAAAFVTFIRRIWSSL